LIYDVERLAAAYEQEVQQAEAALAQARLNRARFVRELHRPPPAGETADETPMEKTAIAELFGVSRPTIDAWIKAAEENLEELAQ
jgi:hypothetical protein